MIIFSKIRFKNFLSYGNIFMDIPLGEYKTTLFCGKNGHGKSTIIDAITFGLYGKPFRKINKSQLINSINKSETVVEVFFTDGSKEYMVRRGIKPNIFEVYCNGVLVTQDAKVKDYQEQLERYILKMNYKSFTQVVILGSARYTPFMQLSAADRRSVIEDLLDIQIFSNMNLIVKDKLSQLKEQIQDCKYNIELCNDRLEIQKQNLADSKKNSLEVIEKKKQSIVNINNEIEFNQNKISEITANNDVLLVSVADKPALETRKQKLVTLGSKVKDNILKIEQEINFYSDHNDCPVCRQSIDSEFKVTVVDGHTTKLNELKVGEVKLQADLDRLNQQLLEITAINNGIYYNNNEISKLQTSISSAQKYINIINAELEDLLSVTNSMELENDKIQALNNEIASYTEKYEEYINEKAYYDYIAIMLKDGGIKTRIIKQYLPVLNKYINQYLQKLDFFVNFNINENFEEVIKSRHRDEFSYANFSEGEKLRLDLAILFSFRQLAKMKNSVNTNLLILDEIMDGSLDTGGTDTFMQMLADMDKTTNVVVISHKSEQIMEKFDSVLTFEKRKNFSTMKVLQ